MCTDICTTTSQTRLETRAQVYVDLRAKCVWTRAQTSALDLIVAVASDLQAAGVHAERPQGMRPKRVRLSEADGPERGCASTSS